MLYSDELENIFPKCLFCLVETGSHWLSSIMGDWATDELQEISNKLV